MDTLKYLVGFVIALFLFSGPVYLGAQNNDYKFVNYDTKDGLSSNGILIIQKDSTGLTYIGTEKSMSIFNGHDFEVINEENYPAYSSSSISEIAVTYENEVIFGGNTGGVMRYIPVLDSLIAYRHDPENKNSIDNEYVGGIIEDSDSMIWVGTWTGLNLFNLENGTFKTYAIPKEPNNNSSTAVTSLMEAPNGDIWIGTWTGGIHVFNKKQKKFARNYKYDSDNPNSIGNGRITDMIVDQNNIIWVATWNDGLYYFDEKQDNFVNVSAHGRGIINPRLHDLDIDQNNRIWTCSDGGISIYDQSLNDFKNIRHDPFDEKTISSKVMKAVLIDGNEIWAGSQISGIDYYNPQLYLFEQFQTEKCGEYILPSNRVSFVGEDGLGRIWIGTESGTRIFDQQQRNFHLLKEYNIPISSEIHLTGMFQYSDEILLLGTDRGYYKYNLNTNQVEFKNLVEEWNTEFEVRGFEYSALENYVWAWSGNMGFMRINLDDLSYTPFSEMPGIGDSLGRGATASRIHYLEEPNLTIIQTFVSVIYYNELTSEVTIYDNKILGDQIKGSYPENDRYFWCLSNKGALYVDREKRKIIDTINSSTHQVPNVYFTDQYHNDNKVWLLSKNYLSMIDTIQNITLNFNYKDGLLEAELRIKLLSDGNMYIYGGNGLNIFDPDEIQIDSNNYNLIFTRFELNNKIVEAGTDLLPKSINYTDELVLNHKQNNLHFEFAYVNYLHPDKHLFKYKMEGLSESWIQIDNRNFVSFNGLSPGNYKLYLSATNSDGVWKDEPKSISIVIKPPFWRTIWFYVVLGLVITLIVILFIRWREKQLKEDKEKLENDLRKGRDEIDRQKKKVAKTEEEIRQRDIEERVMKWQNHGLVKFTDIVSENRDDLNKLGSAIISELVAYLNAEMGALYLHPEEESDELEFLAGFAVNKGQLNTRAFMIGEGLVGTCFKEKNTLLVDDVPDSYTVRSGLGQSRLNTLLFVPILQDELHEGVVEIGLYQNVEKYKIEFVERLAHNLAATFANRKATERIQVMLQESNEKAEQIRSSEEELRQTIEEMEATKEAAAEREKKLMKEIEELKTQIGD